MAKGFFQLSCLSEWEDRGCGESFCLHELSSTCNRFFCQQQEQEVNLKKFSSLSFFKTTNILKVQLCSRNSCLEAVCTVPCDAAESSGGRLLDVGAWSYLVFPVGSLIPAGHGLTLL